MARKGKETDVQVYIKSEEEWEKLIEPQVPVNICFVYIYYLLLSCRCISTA